MIQGQSRNTSFKEYRFTKILAQSLLISKASNVARWPYYHVDLNAGSGFNDLAGVQGSPLNFLDAAERNGRPNFYAFFIDANLACVEELIRRPEIDAQRARVYIFNEDNSGVLPVVSEFIIQKGERPQFAMGTVLIDPNGYHKGVPWRAVRDFCHTHPRFDVVMNLNLTSYRRERALILANRGDRWTTDYRHQPVAEFPAWFNRPEWMLTDPCSMGGFEWVQLVGRTMRTAQPGYSSLGFYDLKSERGQRIVGSIEQRHPSSGAGAELPLLQQL